jgi:hypothetical protein
MAKITAHGEREHVRYEGNGGAAVVLTVKKNGKPGRLLHKLGRDWGYNVAKTFRSQTLDEAARYAEWFAHAREYSKGTTA